MKYQNRKQLELRFIEPIYEQKRHKGNGHGSKPETEYVKKLKANLEQYEKDRQAKRLSKGSPLLEDIYNYIKQNNGVSLAQLCRIFDIPASRMRKHLFKMIKEKRIKVTSGKVRKTLIFYV